MIASAAFAFHVAHFASYNKTCGTMAGVIVFLPWLWITNLAILLGLDFDAETVRQRSIAGGLPPDRAVHAAARHPQVGRGGPTPPGRDVTRHLK